MERCARARSGRDDGRLCDECRRCCALERRRRSQGAGPARLPSLVVASAGATDLRDASVVPCTAISLIPPLAAVEYVGAGAADQAVGPFAALEVVGPDIPDQDVGSCLALDVFEMGCGDDPLVVVRRGSCEIDAHVAVGSAQVENVGTRTSVNLRVAGGAVQVAAVLGKARDLRSRRRRPAETGTRQPGHRAHHERDPNAVPQNVIHAPSDAPAARKVRWQPMIRQGVHATANQTTAHAGGLDRSTPHFLSSYEGSGRVGEVVQADAVGGRGDLGEVAFGSGGEGAGAGDGREPVDGVGPSASHRSDLAGTEAAMGVAAVIADRLNGRPRQTLGLKTPSQAQAEVLH
jgi:hypothetical protein